MIVCIFEHVLSEVGHLMTDSPTAHGVACGVLVVVRVPVAAHEIPHRPCVPSRESYRAGPQVDRVGPRF